MRTYPILLLLLLVATGCPVPPDKSQPVTPLPVKLQEPEFKSEFERLVWLLKSPSFAKRRAAHKKLFAMGKSITSDLEKAAANTASEDHRNQIRLLIEDLGSRETEDEQKDLLVTLSMNKKAFEFKKPVTVTMEVRNTGNVPLQMTVPLLRMRSVGFRLDWRADMSFMSGGKKQPFFATGTERDVWLKDKSWNPATATVKPGESIKENLDISDLCIRPAQYTASATYRWHGVGDFLSNAVSFEITKPPAPEEEPKK